MQSQTLESNENRALKVVTFSSPTISTLSLRHIVRE